MFTRGKLVVFPYWRQNPYVNLTLLAAAAARFDLVSTRDFDSFIAALREAGTGDVVHVHWTSPICQQADSAAAANERLSRFRLEANGFRARGGRLVWTVHNTRPHELPYPRPEDELYRYLARAADLIHVMNPATAAALAPSVELPPTKVRLIPLLSYVGIYPASRSRSEARAFFGLADDERAVLLQGQLRRYKGVRNLFAAIERLPERVSERMVLLLAGRTPEDEAEAIKASLPSNVRVLFHPQHIADDALADWFKAADLCVLPYEHVLNSSSAHLAATMGLPVVLPGVDQLRALYDSESWVQFYDPADATASLARLLEDPATYADVTASAAHFCEQISPWRVSQMMLRDLYLPLAS